MNASKQYSNPKRSLKPIVIALTLALPGSAALAASMNDVVETRADQNIDQQFGRDSVYGFSADKKPLKPEQTGSQSSDDERNSAQMSDENVPEATSWNGLDSSGSATQVSHNAASTGSDKIAGFNVGTGYTSNEQMDGQQLIAVPLETELGSPIAWMDGTDQEYERGYYDDPDVEVIIPDDQGLGGDLSASSDEGDVILGVD